MSCVQVEGFPWWWQDKGSSTMFVIILFGPWIAVPNFIVLFPLDCWDTLTKNPTEPPTGRHCCLCLSQLSLFFFPAGISVSISTFSLVAIAIERYSAICNPLKSRAWQTRSHAYRVITATWVVSLLIMVPYPVFSTLKYFPKTNSTVGHMCRLDWPSEQAEQTW